MLESDNKLNQPIYAEHTKRHNINAKLNHNYIERKKKTIITHLSEQRHLLIGNDTIIPHTKS